MQKTLLQASRDLSRSKCKKITYMCAHTHIYDTKLQSATRSLHKYM